MGNVDGEYGEFHAGGMVADLSFHFFFSFAFSSVGNGLTP